MIHFFRSRHLEEVCPQCTKPHGSRWKPEFFGEIHYKTLNCQTCDYKVFIRPDTLSSGHY